MESVRRKGEIFEYQEEENQGQATQGKPSILDTYLILFTLLCMFHKGLLNCMFLYCYSPCSNYLLAQAPRANLLSSFKMTPLKHLFTTLAAVAC
jgi:hypothetical protein